MTMTFEELEQIVATLTGRRFGWFDGTMIITTGDGPRVHIEYCAEEDELYLYCHVASISPNRFGMYAMELLQANFFGKDTGGSAVLAYDPEQCCVVLWDKFNFSNLTAECFRRRFSLLYLSCLYWSNKMREDILGGQTDAMHVYIGG